MNPSTSQETTSLASSIAVDRPRGIDSSDLSSTEVFRPPLVVDWDALDAQRDVLFPSSLSHVRSAFSSTNKGV